MAHTLSFTVLNDIYPKVGPIHRSLNDLSEATIRDALKQIVSYYKSKFNNFEYECGYFTRKNNFFTGYTAHYDENDIVNHLQKDGWCCVHRFNKYYVIAFAIDFVRFEVFSKDCRKKLIKWRHDDKNDKIVSKITGTRYNENPVVRLMRSIHCDEDETSSSSSDEESKSSSSEEEPEEMD